MNFILLDEIVAAVAGTPTSAVLKARVYDPLGMTASELPDGPELPGPLHGYGWNAATAAFEDKTELDPGPVGGAGAAISSLHDLDVFVRALCTGTQLTPETQAARMRTEGFAGGNGVARYGEAVAQLGPVLRAQRHDHGLLDRGLVPAGGGRDDRGQRRPPRRRRREHVGRSLRQAGADRLPRRAEVALTPSGRGRSAPGR